MDVFPPATFPGVGMGSVLSLVGFGGLLALAATSGMLVAQGMAGALAYAVAAVVVLAAHKDDGLATIDPIAFPVIAAILLIAASRTALAWRARRRDAPANEGAGAAVTRSRRPLDMLTALLAGGAVGYVWSEWERQTFAFDGETAVAVVVGALVGCLGAYAARLFVGGALRSGGSAPVVGAAVVIAALTLNAAGFYIPFAGYLVLAITALFAVRLRRSGSRKYKGLRILS